MAQGAGSARAIQPEEGECLMIYRHLKAWGKLFARTCFSNSKQGNSPTIGHYRWPFGAKDSNGLGNQPTALSL